MEPLCDAVSTYGEDGQEWTYHCALPAGHAETGTVVDDNGKEFTVTTATPHEYVLDDGQTPPAHEAEEGGE